MAYPGIPPDEDRCTANVKNCYGCKRCYLKDEKDLTYCPECGEERRCRRWRNKITSVCQMHGGGSYHQGRAGGRQSATGFFTYKMPQRILERVLEYENDPYLLEMRYDLALLKARRDDLLTRVDSGESGAIWQQLKEAKKEFEEAQLSGDRQKLEVAHSKIFSLIDKGHNDWVIWADIENNIEKTRKVADSQRQWEVKQNQILTAEEVLMFPLKMIELIRNRVRDERDRKALIAGIEEEILSFSRKPAPLIIDNP